MTNKNISLPGLLLCMIILIIGIGFIIFISIKGDDSSKNDIDDQYKEIQFKVIKIIPTKSYGYYKYDIKFIMIKNHQYILFKDRTMSGGTGIVHDPDCQCLKIINNIN